MYERATVIIKWRLDSRLTLTPQYTCILKSTYALLFDTRCCNRVSHTFGTRGSLHILIKNSFSESCVCCFFFLSVFRCCCCFIFDLYVISISFYNFTLYSNVPNYFVRKISILPATVCVVFCVLLSIINHWLEFKDNLTILNCQWWISIFIEHGFLNFEIQHKLNTLILLFCFFFSVCWIYGIFYFISTHSNTYLRIYHFPVFKVNDKNNTVHWPKKLYSTCVLIDCTLSTAWLLICPDPYFLSHSISFYLLNFRLQFFLCLNMCDSL